MVLSKNFTPSLGLLLLLFCASCERTSLDKVSYAEEKQAILKTINEETKAAFRRDYTTWKTYWVHETYCSKTYMNMEDSSFSETLGWSKIDHFVKTYIEQHPTPDPIPTPLADINVRLYGNGAWVEFEQLDSLRGRKRETRLMEKEDGTWKIAGMHTTIYGKNKYITKPK